MRSNSVQMLSPRSHEAIEHREKVKKRRLPEHLKPFLFKKGHQKAVKSEKPKQKKPKAKKDSIKAPIIKV
jgi:hypothetical protein